MRDKLYCLCLSVIYEWVCNQLLINPIIRTRTRLISGIHATIFTEPLPRYGSTRYIIIYFIALLISSLYDVEWLDAWWIGKGLKESGLDLMHYYPGICLRTEESPGNLSQYSRRWPRPEPRTSRQDFYNVTDIPSRFCLCIYLYKSECMYVCMCMFRHIYLSVNGIV
jgi:hypothetical protein